MADIRDLQRVRPGTVGALGMGTLVHGLVRERRPAVLISCAVVIAVVYLAVTFDREFLLGAGPFWAGPRGPRLMDPKDSVENLDVLSVQVGYLAYVRTGWHLPLFFVPDLGTPSGTNIIFVDAIPIAALAGKLASGLAGTVVNPADGGHAQPAGGPTGGAARPVRAPHRTPAAWAGGE